MEEVCTSQNDVDAAIDHLNNHMTGQSMEWISTSSKYCRRPPNSHNNDNDDDRHSDAAVSTCRRSNNISTDVVEILPINFRRIELFLRKIIRDILGARTNRSTKETTNIGTMFDSFMNHILTTDLTDVEYRMVRTILRQQVGDFLRDCTIDAALVQNVISSTSDELLLPTCNDKNDRETIERLVDLCAFFKNATTITPTTTTTDDDDDDGMEIAAEATIDENTTIRRDDEYYGVFCEDDNRSRGIESFNIPPIRLLLDSNLGYVSFATVDRRKRPFITPLTSNAVTTLLRRETLRDRSYALSEPVVSPSPQRQQRVKRLQTVSRHDWSAKIRYLTNAKSFDDDDANVVCGGGGGGGDGGGDGGGRVGDNCASTCTKRRGLRLDRDRADILRAKILNAYGRLAIVEPKLFVCRADRF